MSQMIFGRRHFLGASAVAMLAVTAGPVLAGVAIHTDSDGLVTQQVKIPIAGGEIPAYVAFPAKGKDFSPVVVAHDVFGTNEQMQDVTRRLAKLGYYAICPYLFTREGDVSKTTDEIAIMQTVVAKVADADILSDLDATVAFVRKSGKADGKKLGIAGFGWGGRVVWLYAAHNPKLTAGVSWYGFLQPPRDPKGQSVLALASQIKSPILGLYGAKDDYINDSYTIGMKNALGEKSKSEIVVFPGVKHGFMSDDRPTYDEKAATDSWNRMTIWFKNNGLN
jgi:carboxymethylenebutenolidase